MRELASGDPAQGRFEPCLPGELTICDDVSNRLRTDLMI